jgi:membrane-associated phospholipid phosphatase
MAVRGAGRGAVLLGRAGSAGRWLPAVVLGATVAARAGAQQTANVPQRAPSATKTATKSAVVTSAVTLAIAAAFDGKLQRYAVAHQSATADRIAAAVDPLGRARYIVPGLAGAYLLTRLVRGRSASNAVLRVAAGYAAADAVEAILKPLVGRGRPAAGTPWQFHSLAGADSWHSFPSAHTVHAAALAAGITAETHQRWIELLGLSAAAVVGAQRVYAGAHWPSDVVAGEIIGIAVSQATVHRLQR